MISFLIEKVEHNLFFDRLRHALKLHCICDGTAKLFYVVKMVDNGKDSDDDSFGQFHVNKNGFPIDDKTWNKLWKIASKIYPDAKHDMEQIKNSEELDDVPVSSMPVITPQMSVPQCIQVIQNFINSFSYNHTGTQLFEIKKSRPLAGLMDKAKEMVKEALPIKCLEAVILAIYLTNSLPNVERFPIGFKSVFNGHRYYHVVLGIYHCGYFGALGISRRHDLMDKPLMFKSLFAMVSNYQTAYERYTHQLRKVRLGGLVSHDAHSQEKIHWGIYVINCTKLTTCEQQHLMDQFSKGIRSHFACTAACSYPKKEIVRQRHLHREYTVAGKVSLQTHNAASMKSLPRAPKSASDASRVNTCYHVKV